MLPSKNKINTQSFKEVLKKGKTYNFNHFSLRVLKVYNKGEKSRFTCVVPKKIIKKAVLRNLLKRQVFNIINEISDDINDNFIVIIFCKPEINKLSFYELKAEIISIFRKINLLI